MNENISNFIEYLLGQINPDKSRSLKLHGIL